MANLKFSWSAYEDDKGLHHFCLAALDMSCPQGFSCVQSLFIGIFMCCRLISNIHCPKNYNTMLINNNPQLCSFNEQQKIFTNDRCPVGYTCIQSNVVTKCFLK